MLSYLLRRNNETIVIMQELKSSNLEIFYNYLHNKAKVIENNPATELESPKINERHPGLPYIRSKYYIT